MDLEFHTAIFEDGFDSIEDGFFSGCKGLKKIILTDSIKEIRSHFADNSPVEYLNEGGLLYLGTADNPHYFLVGCADDYDCENLVIAEGTHYVSDRAFDGKSCIRGDISFPASLVMLGELAFRGTSIKHLCIPDDGLGGWMSAFQSRYYIDDYNIRTDESLLESISVPYSCYEDYLKNKDTVGEDWWHRFVNCAITFRNPDGTTAAVLPPNPAPRFYREIIEIIDDEMYYEIEPGQVSGSDDVRFTSNEYITVKAGNKWGLFYRTGKMIVEPQLSDLEIEEYIKTLKA